MNSGAPLSDGVSGVGAEGLQSVLPEDRPRPLLPPLAVDESRKMTCVQGKRPGGGSQRRSSFLGFRYLPWASTLRINVEVETLPRRKDAAYL